MLLACGLGSSHSNSLTSQKVCVVSATVKVCGGDKEFDHGTASSLSRERVLY